MSSVKDFSLYYSHIFISNGGFGGVMQGIQHSLPMVVAGMHEGKNEINARTYYSRYGINLGTETPKPEQVTNAVNKIIADPTFRNNIQRLQKEFSGYNANELFTGYLKQALY